MTASLGFSPAAEMSQLRSQQTLAMTAPAGTAAPTGAASAPGAAAVGPAAGQAAEAAAAPSGATADAGMGAAAVQPPPSTSKIVLQSVLKGAMSGASVTLGIKSFAPMLMKVGFISKAVGSLGVAAAGTTKAVAGAGALGFLSKIPVLGTVLHKVAPFLGKGGGLMGFAIAGLIGAAVGAIGGAISGMKKAKTAAAEYADAMAKAQAAATPPPAETPSAAAAPAPTPVDKPEKVARKPKYKSWVVARSGSSVGGAKFGSYVTKGESMKSLAARFHTTPAEIMKLNPALKGETVPAGTKLKLARKVVPNAKAWTA